MSAPSEVDPEELVRALRKQLDNPELEITIDAHPGAVKVVTIDFELAREGDR